MFDFVINLNGKTRLKKLVVYLAPYFKDNFGEQAYYSEQQIRQAFADLSLNDKDLSYAIAMFVKPTQSDNILTNLNASKTAKEIRKFLIKQLVGGQVSDHVEDKYTPNENIFIEVAKYVSESVTSNGEAYNDDDVCESFQDSPDDVD